MNNSIFKIVCQKLILKDFHESLINHCENFQL